MLGGWTLTIQWTLEEPFYSMSVFTQPGFCQVSRYFEPLQSKIILFICVKMYIFRVYICIYQRESSHYHEQAQASN